MIIFDLKLFVSSIFIISKPYWINYLRKMRILTSILLYNFLYFRYNPLDILDNSLALLRYMVYSWANFNFYQRTINNLQRHNSSNTFLMIHLLSIFIQIDNMLKINFRNFRNENLLGIMLRILLVKFRQELKLTEDFFFNCTYLFN